MTSRRGFYRYLKPSLFPVYGILFAYIIILIARFGFGYLLYEIDVFRIGSHWVTIADILMVGFATIGIVGWLIKR